MENRFTVRRRKLARLLPSGGGALIFSGEEVPHGVDLSYPFSADKNFYYLTGLDLVDGAVFISRERCMLFMPPFDPHREANEGPQDSPGELCSTAGFEPADSAEFISVEECCEKVRGLCSVYCIDLERRMGPCYVAPSRRAERWCAERGIKTFNVYRTVYSLRAVKDKDEIEKIQKAVDITGESLSHMVGSCRAGMREYEWQAAFEFGLRRRGCDTSFPSIVASGKNAVFLHYVKNNSVVKAGDMFLFDVGCFYEHYASDISRTYPVGGRFTQRQKDLYKLVYDATRLVLEYMKPGRLYNDHVVALRDFFDRYLMPMHIVDTEIEKEAFQKMMSRGCCHHLGLDAHDAYARLEDELKPGMVFTNEPGVYIRDEGIGIRIEEDLTITEDGNFLLSRNIPSAPEDIINLLN